MNHLTEKLGEYPEFTGRFGLISRGRENTTELQSVSFNFAEWNIFYLTDLHLDEKLHDSGLRTDAEIALYFHELSDGLKSNTFWYDSDIYPQSLIFLGGDVSHDPHIVDLFLKEFKSVFQEFRIIFVLGNHEYWMCRNGIFNSENLDTEDIVKEYRTICRNNGVQLLHNELCCISGKHTEIISGRDMMAMGPDELTIRLARYEIIILGGTGFSGFNNDFNASNGIYRETVKTVDQDMKLTADFLRLYNRMKELFYNDQRIVVFTHNPPWDWNNENPVPDWYHFFGHTHRDTIVVNDSMKLIGDGQWGYKGFKDSLGHRVLGHFNYDIFGPLGDGIYKISAEQYMLFYRQKGICTQLGREGAVHMLKRDGYYAFLLRQFSGDLKFLEGGYIRSTYGKDVGYFYRNMVPMIQRTNNALAPITELLENISSWVKSFGGSGRIHGLIVDISFTCHVYFDPASKRLKLYYAPDMGCREVYLDVRSLLTAHEPKLLLKYDYCLKTTGKDLAIPADDLVREGEYEWGTDMYYRFSNKIYRMQYVSEANILREWDENLLQSDNNLIDTGVFIVPEDEDLPEIIDLSIREYCQNTVDKLTEEQSDCLDRIIGEQYELLNKAKFGTRDFKIFFQQVKERFSEELPDLVITGSVFDEIVRGRLSVILDTDFGTREKLRDYFVTAIDPTKISPQQISDCKSGLINVIIHAGAYRGYSRTKQRYIALRIINEYFRDIIYEREKLDSAIERLFKRYRRNPLRNSMVKNQILYLATLTDGCYKSNLDYLNEYLSAKLDVLYGKKREADLENIDSAWKRSNNIPVAKKQPRDTGPKSEDSDSNPKPTKFEKHAKETDSASNGSVSLLVYASGHEKSKFLCQNCNQIWYKRYDHFMTNPVCPVCKSLKNHPQDRQTSS